MKTHNIAGRRVEMTILFSVLVLASVAKSQVLEGTFTVTYYDNFNYDTGSWDYWEVGDRLRFWNDEYLADLASDNTKPSAHYLLTVDTLDLRTGFGSLDLHSTNEILPNDDWTPLKSIDDLYWYGDVSPHHVFAAKFTGMVNFELGDVLYLESDDDSYIFLDDNTAWGQEILSDPGQHPFPFAPLCPSRIILDDLVGSHMMTVKFADTHEVQSGIRITVGTALDATIEIEPETVNLGSNGVITAFIEPATDYSLAEIDISTVQCAGAKATKGTLANGKLIVKFNQEELQNIIPAEEVLLAVGGQLTDGRWFYGIDTVRVIDPGAGPKDKKK